MKRKTNMELSNAIEILNELNEKYFQPNTDENFDDTNKAINIAIQALENQIKIKEILDTPILFAEKLDKICELEKMLD